MLYSLLNGERMPIYEKFEARVTAENSLGTSQAEASWVSGYSGEEGAPNERNYYCFYKLRTIEL